MNASTEALREAKRVLDAAARRLLAEQLEADEPSMRNLEREQLDLDEAEVTA